MRSVLRLGLKDKSTTLSDDMEEMRGEPVWNVEDRERGIMDLELIRLETISHSQVIRYNIIRSQVSGFKVGPVHKSGLWSQSSFK